MKQRFRRFFAFVNDHPWVGIAFLILFGFVYCFRALYAPFWVGIAFIALVVPVFILSGQPPKDSSKVGIFFVLSALQVGSLSFMIRPYGVLYGPYDPQAQALADVLKADDAKSVWMSMRELNDMYIQVAINRNGIALPNVYYGDMGQNVEITGDYCGYSFDHLVTPKPGAGDSIALNADMEWSDARGEIPLYDLSLVRDVTIHNLRYYVYRVICDSHGELP